MKRPLSTWVRAVPWLLALVGLAIPLVGSAFAVGLVVSGWLVVLASLWLFGVTCCLQVEVLGPLSQ